MTLFVRFIVSCLLLLGVGLPSTWAQADVTTLKKGVVKIVAESGNEREIGTGFIAAKGKKYLFTLKFLTVLSTIELNLYFKRIFLIK